MQHHQDAIGTASVLLVEEWLQNVWELITRLNIALLEPKAATRLAKYAVVVNQSRNKTSKVCADSQPL